MKGREKSDGRIVPEGRRKAVQTDGSRGGKATTVNQQAVQLDLYNGTAESPKGDDVGLAMGEPRAEPNAVPKPLRRGKGGLPAMTIEEVSSGESLRKAFKQVAANRGAPGPDRQTVKQVREHWSEIEPRLQTGLLNGDYEPGNIRRVWIDSIMSIYE